MTKYINKKSKLFLILIITVTTAFSVNLYSRRVKQESDKVELLKFYKSVKNCITKDDFKEIFKRGDYKSLSMKNFSSDFYEVRTPYKFGAKNWTLYASFVEGKLSEIYIRFNDSHDLKPKDAPDDRIDHQCKDD